MGDTITISNSNVWIARNKAAKNRLRKKKIIGSRPTWYKMFKFGSWWLYITRNIRLKQRSKRDYTYKCFNTRDFPVFVSEYWMPDDFACIAMKGKRVTLAKNKNDTLRAEKIFVQKRYADKYKRDLFV